MLKRATMLCAAIMALSAPVRCDKFPTKRCVVPYNEEAGNQLDIDRKCGLAGDARKDSPEAKQNLFKNNLCADSLPKVVTIADIDDLQNAVDKSDLSYGNRFRGKGPPDDRSLLQHLSGSHLKEGDVVTYVGYLVEAHYMPKSQGESASGETCNCHAKLHEMADIHLALSDKPLEFPKGEPKKQRQARMCQTISAEMTPHLRPDIWNGDNLQQVIRLQRPVRVTGQLFFDGSHEPCKDGMAKVGDPVRRSVWEIHPIYQLEVCRSEELDQCEASNASEWQPISKVEDIDSGDEEEE